MMAGVGPSENVTGSRMAVPATGPMPGSTPTSMPSTQPISANRRFAGSSAVAKPCSRSSKLLNAAPQIPSKPAGNGWRSIREKTYPTPKLPSNASTTVSIGLRRPSTQKSTR